MRTLVATDLGLSADGAARAAFAAQRGEGELAYVHVLPHLQSVRPLFPHLVAEEAAQLASLPMRVAELVGRHVEAMTGAERASFEVFVEEGLDYAEIARRAERWRADRIVVGARGRTGAPRVLGGVAERVARYAPCSVLVHRDSPDVGPVIAATDLSDPSVPAIAAAAAEATRRRAPLLVLHVMDFGVATLTSAALAPFAVVTALPAGAFHQARALATEVVAQHVERLGATAEIVVAEGPAAKVIVDLAEQRQAQLVVVGTRGRTGLPRIVLGRVAERVLRAAPCAVYVVRFETDAT